MRGNRWYVMLAALMACSTAARADWLRAESTHFIVYADDSEAAVTRLATDLEQFDSALRLFHAAPEEDGAGSNKLTVFMVGNVAAVQKLCWRCSNVAGFYIGRAAGSIAVTPRDTYAEGRADLNARTVLLHEYAHHFLLAGYAGAYPAWFSEGYAELASTFRKTKEGFVIGGAAAHRARGLFSGMTLPAAKLFAPPAKMSAEQVELLYGRGWLLTQYLIFDPVRKKTFARYVELLNSGTSSLDAARNAFGDLGRLDRELDKYMRSSTMKAMMIKPEAVPTPKIAVRRLSPGESTLIDERMVSVVGVNDKTAKPLFDRARPVAAKYPDDAVVHGWLAEMAYDADDLAAADAAADRAIAVDPKSAQGLLYKGLIGFRRAQQTKAGAAAWAAARGYVVRANRLDPDSAIPLLAFYNSYGMENRPPTKNAIAGLLRAQELAPQDPSLRYTAMAQSIRDGELDRARALLKPLAYSPHAGADNPAAKLLVALEAIKDKQAAITALEQAYKADDKATDAPAG